MTIRLKKIFASGLAGVLLILNSYLMILSPLGRGSADENLFFGTVVVNYFFILGFVFYVLRYIDHPTDNTSLLLASATLAPAAVIIYKLIISL